MGLSNQSRALVLGYSLALRSYKVRSRPGNFLQTEEPGEPPFSADWALFRINDHQRWPKEKYRLRPTRQPSAGTKVPCWFIGVNMSNETVLPSNVEEEPPKNIRKYKKMLKDLLVGQISAAQGLLYCHPSHCAMLHDISTLSGSSGAAMLLREADGSLNLVGIH